MYSLLLANQINILIKYLKNKQNKTKQNSIRKIFNEKFNFENWIWTQKYAYTHSNNLTTNTHNLTASLQWNAIY